MLAALHSVLLATLGLSPSPLVATRRAALASAAAAVLCRDRASAATYGGGRASRCDSIFAGTFTDPINHPGGVREITLNADGMGGRDATVMGRRLATVAGGGGRGGSGDGGSMATTATTTTAAAAATTTPTTPTTTATRPTTTATTLTTVGLGWWACRTLPPTAPNHRTRCAGAWPGRSLLAEDGVQPGHREWQR